MVKTQVMSICSAAFLLLLLPVILLAGCTAHHQQEVKKPDYIRQEMADAQPPRDLRPAPTPEYLPVVEDLSPIKTRLVDISARNTPLGDVLHVIAEATNLNLLIDSSVPIDYPMTLTLKRVTAEAALSSIFSSLDYFYSIKDNMLVVEGVATRVFELGHPALIQNFSVDVGGDILGSVAAAGGGSSIKGGVTKGSKSDVVAFDFWDSMEKSLNSLLGKKPATTRTVSTQSQSAAGKGISSQAATMVEKSSEQSGDQASGETEQRITVNRLSGTIVVTAGKKNLERVERYLDSVRRIMNRQVLVEARIIEVDFSDNLNYGIDWSFMDFLKSGGSAVAGFGNLNIASRSFNDVVDASVPSFRIGASRTNFQTLLTALKQQGHVNSLSNPRVNVMNGQTSLLSVGRNTSFISKVSTTTTTSAGSAPLTTFNIETSSILSGVLIGIVPFINEQGEITLTVTPIVSDLVNLLDKSIGQVGNQTNISLPTIDLKEMSTTVKVRDGQMVVIGGLISKKENIQDDKVPVLGDIPWLGMLFTKKKKEESRSELIVVLQPRLVSSDN